MSKNDKKYFYKTLAMSNDINLGGWGVNLDFWDRPILIIGKLRQIIILEIIEPSNCSFTLIQSLTLIKPAISNY